MNEKRRGRELGRKPGKEKTQCHREERRCDMVKLASVVFRPTIRKNIALEFYIFQELKLEIY